MRRATGRYEEKREVILDGAAHLFNQHGIKGALLSELAQRVGLATNSLTYYYRKKEDLACACLQRAIDALVVVADSAARQRTLAQRIRTFIGGYIGLLADIAEGRHAELIVFSDLLSLAPPQRDPMAAAYTQMFRRVRGLLDAADAPPLQPAARNARAHLLLSTVSWARAWLSRHEPVDYARVAAQIADIVLLGIATPGRQTTGVVPGQPTRALLANEDDGTATRAAYLRAATRLVNEYGYRGASVDRIAAEL
ncbi:MAG TPA: TetR/AcrR family transcriptional regulator, partial [Burkholderiaceae bacterium]|nr:TetR/AcrR family transcriptional regulator [Burkholderiaceae bacterium]